MRLDRAALRARINLRALLPLLRVVVAERPSQGRLFGAGRGAVRVRVAGTDLGARLEFAGERLEIGPDHAAPAALEVTFRDAAQLNTFFAGGGALPDVRGALRHPALAARTLYLLSSLRILAPGAEPRSREDRALRARLMLYLIPLGLSQMARGGHPDMTAFAAESPDRIYQWTIAEIDAGAYLRVSAGRTRAGRGVYPRRRPFVRFLFPTARGALAVFSASTGQIEAVERGLVVTEGSPEYSRSVSILTQKLDELLMEG